MLENVLIKSLRISRKKSISRDRPRQTPLQRSKLALTVGLYTVKAKTSQDASLYTTLAIEYLLRYVKTEIFLSLF